MNNEIPNSLNKEQFTNIETNYCFWMIIIYIDGDKQQNLNNTHLYKTHVHVTCFKQSHTQFSFIIYPSQTSNLVGPTFFHKNIPGFKIMRVNTSKERDWDFQITMTKPSYWYQYSRYWNSTVYKHLNDKSFQLGDIPLLGVPGGSW